MFVFMHTTGNQQGLQTRSSEKKTPLIRKHAENTVSSLPYPAHLEKKNKKENCIRVVFNSL